jgi:hypothetical protein
MYNEGGSGEAGGDCAVFIRSLTIIVTQLKIGRHRKLTLLAYTFLEPFSLHPYFELGPSLANGAIS